MITLDRSVTDEQGVTAKRGVSPTRNIVMGDNQIFYLLLENGSALQKEDGSRLKLEIQDGGIE